MIIMESQYLEHFGIKGQKWGVRNLSRSNKNANSVWKKGLGPRQLQREKKQVEEAGGGLKGTLKVRKEMVDSGKLSKSDARKGSLRFSRNLAIAVIGGTAAVALGAHFAPRILNRNGDMALEQLRRTVTENQPRSDYVKFLLGD